MRVAVAELDVSIEGAHVHAQVGDGGDGIARALVKAAGQADDVARHDDPDDLPLAVAQKLVAYRAAVVDETKLAILVTVGDQVAPFADHQLAVDDVVEGLEARRFEVDEF